MAVTINGTAQFNITIAGTADDYVSRFYDFTISLVTNDYSISSQNAMVPLPGGEDLYQVSGPGSRGAIYMTVTAASDGATGSVQMREWGPNTGTYHTYIVAAGAYP